MFLKSPKDVFKSHCTIIYSDIFQGFIIFVVYGILQLEISKMTCEQKKLFMSYGKTGAFFDIYKIGSND